MDVVDWTVATPPEVGDVKTSDHQDLLDWMAAKLAAEYRNGAWMESPWFCQEEQDWFTEAGYPLAERQRLVRPLTALYPAKVCRQLLMTPFDGSLVLGLFEQWPWVLMPALDVASSLDEVPWAAKSSLLSGLRRRETFAASASELGVWADLVRAGFKVDREPPVATKDSVARPDFGVAVGPDYCIIEVTALRSSAQERVAELLEEEVFVGPSRIFLDGRLIRLLPSEAFLSRILPRLVELMETDSPEARERVRYIVRSEVSPLISVAHATASTEGARLGLYEAPGIGFLEVLDGATAAECELVPELSPSDVARRLVNKIIEKARQLQEGRRRLRRGVIVIEVERAASIMALVKEVTHALKAGRGIRHFDRLERVDAILLRGSWQGPDGAWHSAAHAITVDNQSPGEGMRGLFYALGGGYMIRSVRGQVRIRSLTGQEYAILE